MKKSIFLFFTLFIFFSGCGEEISPPKNVSDTIQKNILKNKSKSIDFSEKEIFSEIETEENLAESLRPIIVTILENGQLSQNATAFVSNWSKNPIRKYGNVNQNGIVKFQILPKYTFFRISAIKEGFAIISFFTNNLTPGITPIHITLNLEAPGIKITAELISDSEIKIEKPFARIIPGNKKDWTDLDACTSTNCIDNKIIFPAIKSGLENLRITVEGKNIANSISKKFDTCDNIDKTIPVKLFQGVTLNGTATREDGTAVTNFSFRATPRGQYEKRNNPGHVKTNIETDEFGNYEVSGLMKEFYKLSLKIPNAELLITNIWFDEQNNTIDFIFKNLKYKNINGIVLYENSKEPTIGIEVEFSSPHQGNKKNIVFTDETGKFSFRIPANKFYGTIKLNEFEYADVNKNIHYAYNGELITLFLCEKAMIAGTVTTEDGNPASGIFVEVYHSDSQNRDSARSFENKSSYWINWEAYNYKSKTTTDEFGDYIISNVAAPGIYYVSIYNNDYYIPESKNSIVAKVVPDITTICNFQVSKMPIIMLKVRDKNNNDVKDYSLYTKAEFRDCLSSGISTHNDSVSLEKSEEWYRVNLSGEDYKNTKWGLRVYTDDNDEAIKENISFKKPETKFIVLTLCSTQEPAISGFIFTPEELPLMDTWTFAADDDKSIDSRTDHLGYFEIITSQWEEGKKVRLYTCYNEISYQTNVTVGTKDIEWNLSSPPCIIGRVCIEEVNVPATNFAITVFSGNFDGERWGFSSDDGKFSLPLEEHSIGKTGKIFANVTGYAPAGIDFDFEKSKKCDVGDIIVSDLPATINGKVVDHENLPMKAGINLEKLKNGTREKILDVTNDKNTGNFSFTDLPEGTYFILAYFPAGKVESKPIELASGETKTIPDLVAATTNIPLVKFTFVLPDGSSAANLRVNYMNETTDDNGCVEKRMRTGTYKYWTVRSDENTYYIEPIEITEDSKNIQIDLLAAPNISGKVFIDGKPLDNVQLDFQGDGRYYSMARNGLFELQAKPGKYIVSCMERKVVSSVELTEDENNIINFISGNSTFEFDNHFEEIQLSLKFENRNISLVYLFSSSCKGLNEISKLPSGEYTIFASVYIENVLTNITRKATLNNNEKKKIVF